MTNNLRYRGILRALLIRNDERCHRVQFAHSVDVRVVGIVSGGAENQKISSTSLLAKPAKRFIKILAAPHHGNAGGRIGLNVVLIANANILVRRSVSEKTRRQDEDRGQQANGASNIIHVFNDYIR